MGIDETSKGCRVYWPDRRTVTVEHNIYFNNVDAASGPGFEGENEEGGAIPVETRPDAPSNTKSSSISPDTPAIPAPVNTQTDPEASEERPKRVRRGTVKVI